MNEYPLCTSCFEYTCVYSEFVYAIKKKYYEKELKTAGINPEVMDLIPDMAKDIGWIFDAIGIPPNKYCCRRTILGLLDRNKKYKY